jgi:hypothetical protein
MEVLNAGSLRRVARDAGRDVRNKSSLLCFLTVPVFKFDSPPLFPYDPHDPNDPDTPSADARHAWSRPESPPELDWTDISAQTHCVNAARLARGAKHSIISSPPVLVTPCYISTGLDSDPDCTSTSCNPEEEQLQEMRV